MSALAVVAAAGLVNVSGPAVAQDGPLRLEPLVSYQASVKGPGGRLLDIRGTPKNPKDLEAPFISTATARVSPKLCEARYRLGLSFTTNKGHVTKIPYVLRLHRGRLDGVAKRCPFAGLPRRGLKSMNVRVTIGGNLWVRFAARPSTRQGNPFGRLAVPALSFYRSTTPPGLVSVRLRAEYPSAGSHTVEFVADMDVPSARR